MLKIFNNSMKIRKATLKDVKKIEWLDKKYFHESRNYKEIISSKGSEVFVLLFGKEIIGFTGAVYRDWNNAIWVLNIFIHPQYRRKGYAPRLIKFLIDYLKKKKYRTIIAEAPSSSDALPLYLKLGFRVCGFNDRYYSNKGKEIAIFISYDLK